MKDDDRIDAFGRILAVLLSPLLAVAYVGYWLFAVLPEYCRRWLAVEVAGDHACGSIPFDHSDSHSHSDFGSHGHGHSDCSGFSGGHDC